MHKHKPVAVGLAHRSFVVGVSFAQYHTHKAAMNADDCVYQLSSVGEDGKMFMWCFMLDPTSSDVRAASITLGHCDIWCAFSCCIAGATSRTNMPLFVR